jgi:holo-[acyl-carrier protein] synthase
MIVGIGHDLQAVGEMEGRPALVEPELVFTPSEVDRAAGRTERFAALFSAKEAFFKAMPLQAGWCWTDLEIGHEQSGRPVVRCHGELERLMRRQGWNAKVSISHSGTYVSVVAIIHT